MSLGEQYFEPQPHPPLEDNKGNQGPVLEGDQGNDDADDYMYALFMEVQQNLSMMDIDE